MTDVRANLWHETQDAYRRRDVHALYSILARCDEGEAGIGLHSQVSLILTLTRQMKQASRAARSELRRRRADPAWDYETRIRDSGSVRRVRRDMEVAVQEAEWFLRSIEETLSKLDRQVRRMSNPRPPHKPGRPANDSADWQTELPF